MAAMATHYVPDTHDHAGDPSSRDMLGVGRTIPASFSMKQHVPARERHCSDITEAFVTAIETMAKARKQAVVLDEEALEDALDGDGHAASVAVWLHAGVKVREGGTYSVRKVMRVKGSAQ